MVFWFLWDLEKKVSTFLEKSWKNKQNYESLNRRVFWKKHDCTNSEYRYKKIKCSFKGKIDSCI